LEALMKLLVVDGNSILNRAYYGIKLLSTRDGVFTNGIYGFLNILLKMQQESAPNKIAIAFDKRAPTFRHKKYDGYKATRKGMPDELAMQMPYLKELLAALGYTTVECEGFEADDILGTLARVCDESGGECVIATGDRDSLQLVGGGVTVRLASTKAGRPLTEHYGTDEITLKYGVSPKALIDVKALMGDSSDNIPGVAGIGEKTALTLIARFGSLDSVYENITSHEIKSGVKKKLEDGRDVAYLSYELAAINCEVPIETNLAAYEKRAVDNVEAYRLMARLELFSLMEKFGVRPVSQTEVLPDLPSSAAFDIHFGTLPEDIYTRQLPVDVLFKLSDGQIKTLCIADPDGCALYYIDNDCAVIARKILSSPTPKRTNGLKALHHIAIAGGYEVNNVVFDIEIAGYILNPNSSDYSGERLCGEYGVVMPNPGDYHGEYPELLAQISAFPELADKLAEKIVKNGQTDLLRGIELPLAKVLADMEAAGIGLDVSGLTEYGTRLDEEIAELRKRVWQLAGEEFNIASTKQLGVILFERLQLPSKKKTKTGYSTDADTLDALRDKHPIIEQVLEYRKLTKLKSTYVDGLTAQVNHDGRVRTTFLQTQTRTGRISSIEPNMQNIPVRTPRGSELRRFFTASEGKILLDADYSQIELRVLAHMANDESMISAFANGEDIHTNTAAQVFGLPPDFVTPLMRSRAKAVNFGIVYGIGAYSLSQDIGVSVAEADRYIKDYLAAYAGIRQYMEDIVKFGEENGFVETLYSRRRYLPELTSKNRVMREFGKRAALNTPIQGTAADIIKIAMVRVYERLKSEKLVSRLILQVHDELIIEAPLDEAEKVHEILAEEMMAAANLSIPLVADVSSGTNWLEAK